MSAAKPASSAALPLRPMNVWARFWRVAAYIALQQWARIILLGLAIACSLVAVLAVDALRFPGLSGGTPPEPGDWPDWVQRLQVFFGVFTLLIAVFVWYGEVREDWEDSLPKLLSVYFFHGNVPVFVCRQAWLAHEGDIRAMGQSIGQQMNNGVRLDFVPYLHELPPQLVLDSTGHARKHCRVKFRLVEVPAVARRSPADPKTVGTAFFWHGEAEDKATPVAPEELLTQPDVAEWLLPQSPPR